MGLDSDNKLLINIKMNLSKMKALLKEVNSHWEYEDHVYRFYHYSFKVYWLQKTTIKIVDLFSSCKLEGVDFCPLFQELLKEGSDKEWNHEHNLNWSTHTRPIVEAFFHSKFFLEMAVKYGKELKTAPELLPSGWAALLELYSIR